MRTAGLALALLALSAGTAGADSLSSLPDPGYSGLPPTAL